MEEPLSPSDVADIEGVMAAAFPPAKSIILDDLEEESLASTQLVMSPAQEAERIGSDPMDVMN